MAISVDLLCMPCSEKDTLTPRKCTVGYERRSNEEFRIHSVHLLFLNVHIKSTSRERFRIQPPPEISLRSLESHPRPGSNIEAWQRHTGSHCMA